jgi:integrase
MPKPSESFKFNPRSLAALQSRPTRYEVANGDGLRLRIYPPTKDGKPGSKAFRWSDGACREACCPSTPHRHDFQLGYFDSDPKRLSGLADAQRKLEELKTPEGHRKAVEAMVAGAAPALAASSAEMTVGQLGKKFYAEVIVNRRKRPEIAADVLRRDIEAAIGAVPLSRLTPDVCAKPVQNAVSRGSPAHAVRVLQVLKQLTRWAVGMQFLDRDPAAALDAENLGASIGQRDRLLTLDELGTIFAALNRSGCVEESTRVALKLLFSVGLRTFELLTLRWEDVDLDAGTVAIRPENLKLSLRATRQRKGQPYIQPLSAYAVSLLKKMRAITGKFPYVFASWGDSGRMTDRALSHAVRRMRDDDPKVAKMERWTPHDARRALASWASDNYDEMLAQRLLGHSVNTITGSKVGSTYDQGQALKRKRVALDAWGAVLEALDKTPKREPSKVVNIHR